MLVVDQVVGDELRVQPAEEGLVTADQRVVPVATLLRAVLPGGAVDHALAVVVHAVGHVLGGRVDRGVEVVGAWRWLDEYDFGVCVEVDAEEAFRPVTLLKWAHRLILAALGLGNLEHASSIRRLNKLLRDDYRGIVVTMIHKFRDMPAEQLSDATPAQACAHPNWSMGRKISVDSATLMNKGLEVIEARWLFNARPEQIKVLVHPQSIVHSMVSYRDGSVIAQLGTPDMRTPIANVLSWPERIEAGVEHLNLAQINDLSFREPDLGRFPCLALAFQAMETRGGTLEVLMTMPMRSSQLVWGKFLSAWTLLLVCLLASFANMRWAGPMAVALFADGSGYRALRDTAPWKLIGFITGGTFLVVSLMTLVDGRPTWRGVLIGLAAVLAMIAIYDLPFDDLLLPPNGDV